MAATAIAVAPVGNTAPPNGSNRTLWRRTGVCLSRHYATKSPCEVRLSERIGMPGHANVPKPEAASLARLASMRLMTMVLADGSALRL